VSLGFLCRKTGGEQDTVTDAVLRLIQEPGFAASPSALDAINRQVVCWWLLALLMGF